METNYKKIHFGAGENIEAAINQLEHYKSIGELVYGDFNGQKLYSDKDDLDSAYLKITGKTKVEFDTEMKAENDRYKAEKKKHEEAIPELTKEWIEKGKATLDEQYHEKWEKCVPIRLSDLYQGMELKCCLDIVKALNDGCSLETAKSIIDSQDHSGMSHGLVCSMVKAFCNRGSEFVSFVR